MGAKFGVNKAVYKAIKSVLGKKEAQYQLACVVESSCDVNTLSKGLSGAFSWTNTPQGFDYWCDIYRDISLQKGLADET
jgi:hypothetical protein